MGNSCSSGQAHKDKDNMSQRSEESGSYHVRTSIPSEKQQALLNHVSQQQHCGVLLEPSTAGQPTLQPLQPTATSPTVSAMNGKKPPLSKVLRGVAPTSISDSMSLSSPPGIHSPKGFEHSHLPPIVCSLSEDLQNLIMGRISEAKITTRTQKIVIYVCAADSQDCCVEKGSLHNVIYPELRAHCRSKGYELHIVDLHWKTPLEKQQDHEFPELCIGELTRQMEIAYIIPVLFLNNSLGTSLLPITIESADFKMALDSAESQVAQTLLSKWYQLDSAAQPPCYRLQPIASHIPGFKETSQEERERALEEWRGEIDRMLAIFVNILPQELRDTYLTTVVEQEVHNTVFMSQELAKRCIWLNRVYTPSEKTPENLSPREAELKRRLNNLQRDLANQLLERHIMRISVKYVCGGLSEEIPEHKLYVEHVVDYLKKNLLESIDAIMEEHHNKTVLKPTYGIDSSLFEELTQQTTFCQRAAQCSINREKMLSDIEKYIVSDNTSPLVIVGPVGCGKSTLLSRIAQCSLTWQPEAFLIVRFVGISAQSSSIQQLLHSITNQCSILTHGHQSYETHNMETYAKVLPALLNAICLQRPLIVLIDGIDQVKCYNSCTIDWLPNKLPDNVKLILSVAEDCSIFEDIKGKIDAKYFIKMSPLDETEATGILLSSVMQYNHSVNSHIKDCVLTSVQQCTLPLYVKVLAWQTSWYTEKEHEIVPKGNIIDQLSQMLEKLEKILGITQVQHALALMTCTKDGITDSEMIDLLAYDDCFHNNGTYVVWAPACLTWSRLNKHLAPFLQWTLTGGVLGVQWRDNTFLQAVKTRYKEYTTWANTMLYDYYMGKWWNEKPKNLAARLVTQHTLLGQCYNRRKLDELPYQYHQLNPTKLAHSPYLNDLEWIYEKVCGSSSFQLLEDIYLAQTEANEFVVILRDFLEKFATTLNYDGRQFYAQFYNYLTEEGRVNGANKQITDVFNITRNPPVTSLVLLNSNVPSDPDTVTMCQNKVLNLIIRLPDTEQFVASVSTNLEEICVWDIQTSNKVRTLKGITHPINLIPIDQAKCIVLCRRELKIYNLDSGTFITKLKGVMNQKMPYFGLNDQSHLVALSRNRMYVNLMNLETGDCVATFKVGEDRFLNSLLVSGDGRVLVCGDEVQKPFPLLVWNLTSKKLQYDLRIPHHDFNTSLAAITHEGNYVCCVCHEIDEPNPNFIVVYDLQSGTLFKKWKPSCSTVSLEISSQVSCVISGLVDARILVWDLITGNCRWSLCGHTAPVSSLRLDPTGVFCLSSDRQGRDKSIRVWNLQKGSLVAVYTPRSNITACEIMSNGKHIVLATEGSSNILTLQLRGPGVEVDDTNYIFGDPENDGKVFEVKDGENC
ncbi:hypothetical protein PPYR_01105 [Photinus pyralis]|uniref:Uncharacterized protein n=1 Tax=Photinus pyralis TaxID=7054 RepID=A0A1Y1LF63_PHOPY|nr:NACHT domain- and WD repeat-containing protein 1 isoform X2 [Photinus pyralis]KAB0804135.1 hypothetical protein PPYR_01105 [Photinus pyralis]